MGRLASTWIDPIIGLDLHLQIVIRPPLPIFPFIFPHPYIGLVFDPMGLVVGLAISNVIGAVAGGGGFKGPVLVNGLPATNAGTESIGLPVLHWPYMGAWLPFPRLTPPIRPGKPPSKPIMPIPPNDATVITGSDSVDVMGASMSRMGDIALSCSDPIRLPTSFIIAIPKGRPVLVGGGTAIDFLSAAIGILSSAYITTPIKNFLKSKLQKLAGSMKSGRLRNLWADIKCFFTGHPVDVATGRLMVHARDWSLGEPSVQSFERRYFSSWCERPSTLGHGWSHTYDEAIWEEPGRVVLRKDDGREIEIDELLLGPDTGEERFEPLSRLWVRRIDGGWTVRDPDGERRRYLRLAPGDTVARLVRIEQRGRRATTLEYESGRVARVRDAAGRVVRFVHDDLGRIVETQLPHPELADTWEMRTRYVYSADGDLVEVHDAEGGVGRYVYDEHLLVQEIDANGKSFYFGYDGRGASAYCIRTWGDGGLFDHVIDYDKKQRVTRVYDSNGARKTYRMNEVYAVTEIVDAKGGKTTFAYDDNLWTTRVRDAASEEIVYEHDAGGRVVAEVHPDGSKEEREYDGSGRLVRRVDRRGGVWKYRFEPFSTHVVTPDAAVTRLVHDDDGLLVAVIADEKRWSFQRDDSGNTVLYTDCEGRTTKVVYDRLGRPLECERDSVRTTLSWNRRGDPIHLGDEAGSWQRASYDGEGNIVEEVRSDGAWARYSYDAANQLVRVVSHDRVLDIRRDGEGRVLDLDLSDGRGVRYERDLLGRVVAMTGLDGLTQHFRRDALGRTIEAVRPDGSMTRYAYGRAGRDVRVTLPDGEEQSFELDALGLLVEAKNSVARIRFERDLSGRIVREWCDDDWVESAYDRMGRRERVRDARGFELNVVYDDDARALDLVTSHGVTTVEHDQNGLERERRFSDGVAVHWKRDAQGRPVERVVRRAGEVLSQREYLWSGDGSLAGWEEGDLSATIQRDPTGRPTALAHADGTVDVRRLDDRGRPHGAEAFRYDGGGRVLEAGPHRFRWNELGQLAEKRHRDGSSWAYRYDGAGRLAEATTASGVTVRYRYDALGRVRERLAGGRRTQWRWDGDRVLEHRHDDGAATRWLFHPMGAVPLAELGDAGVRAAITDDVGTLQALVDSSGAIVQRELDLFGRARDEANAPSLGFPGQWADRDIGLHYNHHRFYDADVGRYTTPDPIGLYGGLDPYGYVTDPFAECDPLGLSNCRVPIYEPGVHLPEGHFVHWTTEQGWAGMQESGDIWKAKRPAGPFLFVPPIGDRTIKHIQGGAGIYVTDITKPNWLFFSFLGHGANPKLLDAPVRIGVIIDTAKLVVREHVGHSWVIKNAPISIDYVVGIIKQVVKG
jgi:RHS repeat-associated protein